MSLEVTKKILNVARAEGRSILLETEGYALLESVGLNAPAHLLLAVGATVQAGDLEALRSSEVVLKVVSPDVLHKSDVGGVRIVPRNVEAVEEGARAILEQVRLARPDADLRGVMVAEKVRFRADVPGTELLLSVRRDPAFGPVLMCGPGGVLTEWYGALSRGHAHMLFAADGFDAERAIAQLRRTPFGKQALEASRLFATAPVSAAALARALTGLATLATYTDAQGPLLEEIELNPVVAVDGEPIALDALVRVAAPAGARRRPRPIAKIAQLLHPRSAAVYGASANTMNAGRIILDNLKHSEGLEYGRLWAVHPKAERIDGVPCVASTADLPTCVDLAVIAIPADRAGAAIDELVELDRAASIILIPGGFAETGEGERAKEIVATLAASRDRASGGPVLVGGNCLGIVSKREYNTFFLPTYKLPFHDAPGDDLVAVSQSGAYLVTFTSNLDGIVFPRASVSYGNEMDLTASDFLEYYLDHGTGPGGREVTDPKVFAFYLEGFQPGEGERFLQLVRRARADGRAVVVYKAGQTEIGAKAAASHTASVAGDYRVVRSLLLEAGAAVCETLNMFEDVTKVLTMLQGRRARGPRVGVITNAGFECGAVSDHLYGLQLAEFSPATLAAIEAVLPEIGHCANPIDCTPMTDTSHFVKVVEILAAAPEVDSLLVSAVPAAPTLDVLAPDPNGIHRENVFALQSLPAELGRVFRTTDKPVVAAIDSGRLYDSAVLMLERLGVPVYRKIDRASRALSAFVDHGEV